MKCVHNRVTDSSYNGCCNIVQLVREHVMAELTATVAETRANFSKIATMVAETGQPVTVFKNSKPWVAIAPLSGRHITTVDWNAPDIARPNADGVTVLPAEWYCPEDDGLYDDLV